MHKQQCVIKNHNIKNMQWNFSHILKVNKCGNVFFHIFLKVFFFFFTTNTCCYVATATLYNEFLRTTDIQLHWQTSTKCHWLNVLCYILSPIIGLIKKHLNDQVNSLRLFSAKGRLLLLLTTAVSSLWKAAVCKTVAAQGTCPQAPYVSRLTYFILCKVPQLPPEPLYNKDTILSSLEA